MAAKTPTASFFARCAQGKRYSLANSRIMIHQPLGGAQGQAADIEIQANEILHHKLTLNGYIAEFSGQPMEKVTADTDRDFFMSAQEAVEYGMRSKTVRDKLCKDLFRFSIYSIPSRAFRALQA